MLSVDFNWLGVIRTSIKNQKQSFLPTFLLPFSCHSERPNQKIWSKSLCDFGHNMNFPWTSKTDTFTSFLMPFISFNFRIIESTNLEKSSKNVDFEPKNSIAITSSVIRKKGESQHGRFKKTRQVKFSEKRICVRVRTRRQEIFVFRKIWRVLFPWNTHFEMRHFALLPTKS